ncbi:MAG TPA: D-xylose transporter subunit XylF [Fibrobacteres bacterium]|jgi:D-xylose transport system substrate-binding protein|nr:D-xylose transporter subunit XylF [Fibrobacterota bacterium]
MKHCLPLLIASIALLGCNKKESSTTPAKPLIGFSLADLKEERWQRDRDFFTAKAESLGAEVIVQDASGDPNAQLRQCDALLAKGVKVLVVVPKNADAARPIVLNAHAKGVKVISYDRLIGDSPVDLYLSFDNEKVGEIQAQAIATKVPKGNYLVLKGDPADKNSDMVHAGHLKILQPLIDKGDIKVVAEQSCDKWLRSEALRITADALQKNHIDAIVASNDGTASGAIAALEAKGMAGKIPVSGQDADLIACQYIWKGIQTVTVYKPIKKLAEAAAELAVHAAKGDSLNAQGTQTLQNGEHSVPALFLDPVAVTKENLMETVVKDGFHTEEDVKK